MNKIVLLVSFSTMLMVAKSIDLGTIEVSDAMPTKVIESVSSQEVKTADIAETLYKQIPSINLIRRSGIANDITIRGQKRDNIIVTMDDSKLYGACPNRMDPPTSHIVNSSVESIVVTEGPYDSEEFGNLSGSVKVKTKQPIEDFQAKIDTTIGSFEYQKIGLSASAKIQKVTLMVDASIQRSAQYKDGDGNSVANQIKKATTGTPQASTQLQDEYHDIDAYEKKTIMAKAYIDIADNQDLELSFTANRSDGVIYGNSKMDALTDDSNIYNLQYTIQNIGKYSDKLKLKTYLSDVVHPMSTKYRKSSGINSANEVISELTTKMQGVKLINDMKLGDSLMTYGLDMSKRNWDGSYIGKGTKAGITGRVSIDDVDTRNNALFVKISKEIGEANIKVGARYNDTVIDTANILYSNRDFHSLDINTIVSYNINNNTKYFLGLGHAARVPDARELYFTSMMNVMSGTPTLDQTRNTQIDFGFETSYDNGYLKLKTFYSNLDNYIYFNQSNQITMMGKQVAYHSFENVDAYIYGIEIAGSYDILENLYVEYSGAYQRGKKDEALTSQSDKNLADITPVRVNMSLNYEYDDTLSTKLEMIATKNWNQYDSDNGEQPLFGYAVFNVKANKSFNDRFSMSIGVDNILDKTYAVSNTYADLILLSDGTSGEVMLLNEPGRYLYVNFEYKFF